MGKTTWKKALINSAHTFMDYVVGWRGFNFTNQSSTKRSAGSFVVPQKVTEVPVQTVITDNGQGTAMNMYYNLPFEIGFQGTLRRYRYPANNQPYQYLSDFNLDVSLGDPCVKVDYRNNLSQNWNKSVAGVAITGSVSNYIAYGTDISAKNAAAETVWRRLGNAFFNGSTTNLNDICSAQLYEQNFQQPIDIGFNFTPQETPFEPNSQGSAQFDMGVAGLWKVPRRLDRYARVLDSKQSTSKDRKETFSFYIWNGALNEEFVSEGLASFTPQACSFIEGGYINLNANTLNNGKLACQFQSAGTGGTNWSDKADNSDTYFTIDILNRKFDQYVPDPTGVVTKLNYRIIDNVQFEDCPNNYLRISIFYKPNPNEAANYRYTRFAWYTATVDTTAKDIYDGIFNPPPFSAPKLAGQVWKDKYLIMFGQQLEVSFMIPPNTQSVEYVHNDYIPNNTETVRNNSLTQLAIPNFVTDLYNGEVENNDRCQTIYFSLWLQNQDSRPNKENSGGYGNTGRNFANIQQIIYNWTGAVQTVTQRNKHFITLGNDFSGSNQYPGFENLTEFQKKNTRYVMYLTEDYNQNTQGNYIPLPQIEGLNFIYLNSGENKFAFKTGSNKVFVNGKEYATDDDHYNARFIQRIEFYGKRQDYLLEYGTWKENQADDVLIQLTKV